MRTVRLLTVGMIALVPVLLLSGCQGERFADLKQWMQQVKARPAKPIPPIPTFPPYQAFTYSAMAKRSPFQKPVAIKELARLSGPASNVKPDPNRPKEYLEKFPIESLTMVGTLKKGGRLWALINDGQGGVHAVTIGNYIGRNNGKIVSVGDNEIQLREIVPNGANGWVARPRTMRLREAE